jgi:NADH-quinone oxidoreductase subunit H
LDSTAVEVTLRVLVVIVAFLVCPLVVGQCEHKVMAHMQGRMGPMYAGGYHGWAQLVADAVKFVQKEEVVPAASDRWVYRIAPAVALVPYMVAMAVVPLTATVVADAAGASLLFVLAASAVGVVGTLMAGWASANKYSLVGAMRSAAQLLSYEVPIVISACSVAMAAGTLSLPGIVQQWEWWWLIWQAPAAFVFFVGGLAEIQRSPFDMPIADTELVVGPYTEYGGLRFALFLFTEYAGLVLLAAMTTVLFLGGWRGPFAEHLGPLWTIVKIGVIAFAIIWFRVSWPRLREDQLQRFSWTVLVPVSLVQLMITAIVVLAW